MCTRKKISGPVPARSLKKTPEIFLGYCSNVFIVNFEQWKIKLNELLFKSNTQPAIACSKLTIETLERSVKYVQSWK